MINSTTMEANAQATFRANAPSFILFVCMSWLSEPLFGTCGQGYVVSDSETCIFSDDYDSVTLETVCIVSRC